VEGRLSTRADATKHTGDYRQIIEGVNQTLDAVIGPVQEAGAVVKKIAAGDLSAQVAGNYQGDHADIKNDINAMTEALRTSMRSIAENAQSLSSASEELTATSQQMSANAEETSARRRWFPPALNRLTRTCRPWKRCPCFERCGLRQRSNLTERMPRWSDGLN
jgi:methyl-accepting chemotaxis protein